MNRPTDVSAEIARLSEGIDAALDLGTDRVPADLRSEAQDLLAKSRARLDLGEDRTVVAFAGSTGSGKSSLFNAVAGLEIARVGVRRPTTSLPTACVWGGGGEELLTWLGVPVENRAWRESALDGDDETALRGLVLLDLPDHDSTAAEHRLESDRLVGLVDVLVWVVDPQKYADFSLHHHYLSRLAEHAGSMVVVLNQVDRLQPEEREACLDHLRRLLDEDGLGDTPVTAASAVSRQGVPGIRRTLERTVAGKAAAAERLAADLRSVAGRIRTAIGDPPLEDTTSLPGAERLVSAMTDAAGVDAVAQTVADDYRRRAYRATGYPLLAWAQRGKADPLGAAHGAARDDLLRAAVPEANRTQRTRVSLAARELVSEVAADLPGPWRKAVTEAGRTSAEELTDTLDSAVTAVRIERERPGWWAGVGFLQVLFLVLTCLGLVGLLVALGVTLAGAATGSTVAWLWIVPVVLLLIGLLGSLITSRSAAGARERGALAAGDRVRAELVTAVQNAAAGSYLSPITSILDRHRAVWEGLR
ncbi:GTPase [Brevibacterium litoralis]|uniref:GTPase n=1 Tax=Brevibacterium litoralis TaxID=3138935 RepID=UPI0032ED2A75